LQYTYYGFLQLVCNWFNGKPNQATKSKLNLSLNLNLSVKIHCVHSLFSFYWCCILFYLLAVVFLYFFILHAVIFNILFLMLVAIMWNIKFIMLNSSTALYPIYSSLMRWSVMVFIVFNFNIASCSTLCLHETMLCP